MLLRYIILWGLLSVGGCCWYEPYPTWDVSIITADDIPKVVAQSFRSDHPNVTPKAVERSIFRSRCLGYPEKYRFHLPDGHSVTYDEAGTKVRWSPGYSR